MNKSCLMVVMAHEGIIFLTSSFTVSFVALEFDVEKGATKLPKQIKYSLRLSHTLAGDLKRWRTDNTYPNFQAVGPRKDDERSEI